MPFHNTETYHGAKNFKKTVLPAVSSSKLAGVRLGTAACAAAMVIKETTAVNFIVRVLTLVWTAMQISEDVDSFIWKSWDFRNFYQSILKADLF